MARFGDRGLLGEFAFKAARAPALVPSCDDGWEELSGECIRRPPLAMGP